jgi:hypothetical protein
VKEVRALEGTLADYNLTLDKSRTSMVRGRRPPRRSRAGPPHVFPTRCTAQDASEIVGYLTALKRRNEATSREVDSVFIERSERERGAHRLEEQVSQRARRAGRPS